MRLLAWNVRSGKAPQLFDAIVEMDPDLAVLTECRRTHAAELIAEGRTRGYPYALQDFDEAGIGLCLISSRPIMRGEVLSAPLPGRWLHALTHDGFSIGAVYGPLPAGDGAEVNAESNPIVSLYDNQAVSRSWST